MQARGDLFNTLPNPSLRGSITRRPREGRLPGRCGCAPAILCRLDLPSWLLCTRWLLCTKWRGTATSRAQLGHSSHLQGQHGDPLHWQRLRDGSHRRGPRPWPTPGGAWAQDGDLVENDTEPAAPETLTAEVFVSGHAPNPSCRGPTLQCETVSSTTTSSTAASSLRPKPVWCTRSGHTAR